MQLWQVWQNWDNFVCFANFICVVVRKNSHSNNSSLKVSHCAFKELCKSRLNAMSILAMFSFFFDVGLSQLRNSSAPCRRLGVFVDLEGFTEICLGPFQLPLSSFLGPTEWWNECWTVSFLDAGLSHSLCYLVFSLKAITDISKYGTGPVSSSFPSSPESWDTSEQGELLTIQI